MVTTIVDGGHSGLWPRDLTPLRRVRAVARRSSASCAGLARVDFIGLAVYCGDYLKRHYERVAVETACARLDHARVARVAQKLEEVYRWWWPAR